VQKRVCSPAVTEQRAGVPDLPALHANDYKGIHLVPKTKHGVEATAKKSASWIEFIADSFMYTATVLETTFIEPGMAKRLSVQSSGSIDKKSKFAHVLAAHILHICCVYVH